MTLLLWRQHRRQGAAGAALLLALAVAVVVTGVLMSRLYREALASCAPAGGCRVGDDVFRHYAPMLDVIGLTLTLPALAGLFWGAPLVAREIEEGTHRLAWTQSVPRRSWLRAKVGLALAAATVWGAAVGGLVTWWSRPENSVNQYRFQLGHFDTQGIAPIGYSVFAVALGITAGAVLRRTLPAMGVTLGGFMAVRFVVDYVVRQHYLASITKVVSLGGDEPELGKGSNWIVSQGFLLPDGRQVDALRLSPGTFPAACTGARGDGPDAVDSCLGRLGYRRVVEYQPASHFWPFQLIETGLYLVLAAVLVAVAFRVVLRRDA